MASPRSCEQCGKPLPPEGRFCAHCGSFSGAESESSPGGTSRRGPWERILERLRRVAAPRYDVQRLLGWGGMAGVYLAEELRLKRRVAIKVISPGLLMDPSQVERFEQEARTTAQLNHPNIVTIYEVDEREDLHYFTMTYVPGRSLSQVMAEASSPLPIAVVEAWLRQIAGALSYAHQRGVVHRDIKPGNILLDEQGNALVGDFGIAKVAEEPGLTRTGMLVGTPAYMSPEQCTTGKVTGASDQYSLGSVAYQLITGATPFTGSTIHVIQAHVGEQPRPIGELRPECPEDLAEVVMRMLAKDPEDRWPSLYDAVDALGGRALRHDDPVRAAMARLAAWTHGVVVTPPASLAEDAGGSTLEPEGSYPFEATAVDYRGEPLPDRAVEWSASPEGVVEVDESGRVRPLAPGRARLRAASGRVHADWALKVASSADTGPVTPAPGITAPDSAPAGGDPSPTPGPPPPPSSGPAEPPSPAASGLAGAPSEPSPGPVGTPPTTPPPSPGPATPPPDPARTAGTSAEPPGPSSPPPSPDRSPVAPPPSAPQPPREQPTPAPSDPVPTRGPVSPAAAASPPTAGDGTSRRTPLLIGAGVLGVAVVAFALSSLGGDDGGAVDESPTTVEAPGVGPTATDDPAEGGGPAEGGAELAEADAGAAGDGGEEWADTVRPAPGAADSGEEETPAEADDPEPEDPPVTEATEAETAADPPVRPATRAQPAPGTVDLLGDLPAGVSVRIRGEGIDRTSGQRSLRLPPGRYTLEARADGYRSAVTEVTVQAGARQEWRPALSAIPAPPPEADDPPPAETEAESDPAPSAEAAAAREAAIVQAIRAFGAALESRDPGRLRSAWPGISDAQARPWEQFMGSRDVRDLEVEVTIPSVPPDGGDDRVVVPVLLRLRYQNPGAPPPADPIPYRATVERSDGSWVLTGLQAGN